MSVGGVYRALLEDQCVRGFAHTEGEILTWICGCTDEAVESLCRRIGEHLDDIRLIREQEKQRLAA